jgi:hypothetical protein
MIVNILGLLAVLYFTYLKYAQVALTTSNTNEILWGVLPWFILYLIIWFFVTKIKDFII